MSTFGSCPQRLSAMRKIVNRFLLIAVALLLGACVLMWRHMGKITCERDRYRQNSEVLLSDIERIRIDSTRMAVDVKTLRLSVSEFERYRAEDTRLIKKMGIRIRNLEAAARHEIEIAGPIDATVRDTVIIRDSVPILGQKVEMINPFIELKGIIENERLKGTIRVPVTLHQAVWIEYKRRWIFWKRVKAIHQTIVSDNPYVNLTYSEYIKIVTKD